MTEFITIGEPMAVLASQEVDVALPKVQHFKKFLAGAELNVALGIARLGHTAGYISKVGTDSFGQYIKESVKNAGIDTSNFLTDQNFLTGFYLKQKVSTGDPQTDYFRKNSAASNFTKDEIDAVRFDGVKLAHLTGIFPALSESSLMTFQLLIDKLNATKILSIFDPNLRPALWESTDIMVRVTNELAKLSQIILPGVNEGEILMGSREPEKIADFYLAQSKLTQIVIIKLGSAGAFVKVKSGQSFTVPSFKVSKVIDTVGAGDGFAVGLESALLENKSIEVAVRRACAIGALAVQTPGDNDGYPTRAQLHEFYMNNEYKGDI